jgi:hypothetical protein
MKKVLLIMPNFFDYPQAICDELERMGYEVDCFDDRPSTNGFVKAIIRVNKDLIGKYIARYFEKVMRVVRGKKYDIVFLISGQSLSFSERMIQQIKDEQPQAEYILYQWDSLKNFPYIKKIEPLFDRCYSFDRRDVQSDSSLHFLPLFYTRRYEEIGKLDKKVFKYDFCFVGTAHPKKYKFIKMMSEQLKTIYPNQFIYYFFPSRIVFFYRKIMNPELHKAKYREFHFESLSGKQMDDTYSDSRCVLDSAQAGQLGLTIRVLEALGAKKKLITTNEDVVNYDFYRRENIYVYDGTQVNLNDPFFTQSYQDLDEDVYEKYSLRSWLKTMLTNSEYNGGVL